MEKKYENEELEKKVIRVERGYDVVVGGGGWGKRDMVGERVVGGVWCGV